MKQRWLPLFGLLVWVALVHGLLLLSDGVFWDDWLWLRWPAPGIESQTLLATFREMGSPPTIALHVMFLELVGLRLGLFLCILGIAVNTYLICRALGYFSLGECLFLAMAAVSFPAFRTWQLLATANYVFSYAVFTLATLLLLRSEATRGSRAVACRVLALPMFLLAFNLNSLLVLFYGVLLLVAVRALARESSPSRALAAQILRRADLALLPIGYWVLKQTFFPRHGLYLDYNRIDASPLKLVWRMARFLNAAVVEQLNAVMRLFLETPVLAGLLVLAALLVARRLGPAAESTPGVRHVRPRLLWVSGLGLLALAMFPYIVVRLGYSATNWETRHALLVGVPVALCIVAVLRYFGTSRARSSIRAVSFTLLLGGFAVVTIQSQIEWQARWVRDRSVVEQLRARPEHSRYSVYLVDLPATRPESQLYGHNYYEWSSMFRAAWGTEGRVGFSSKEPVAPFLESIRPEYSAHAARYRLSGFDPLGCRALLTVDNGPRHFSDFEVVGRYLYDHLLHPRRLPRVLAAVASIRVSTLAAPEARNCQPGEAVPSSRPW